jgi:tetratricopeptide (TPR) repeat protein
MKRSRSFLFLLLILIFAGTAGCYLARWRVMSSASVQIARAVRLIQAGLPKEALAQLSWILWFEPGHPQACRVAGMAYFAKKDFPASIKYLNQVTAGDAGHEEVQIFLGTALMADLRLEDAASVLRETVLLHPDSITARTQLCQVLQTQLRQDEAIAVWRLAVQTSDLATLPLPECLHLLHETARSQFHPPALELHINLLQTSLSRHPEQDQIRAALATCLAASGERQAAGEHFAYLLNLAKPNQWILLKCAQFYFQIGAKDVARATLVRLRNTSSLGLEVESISMPANRLTSLLQDESGNQDEALKAIEAALLARPVDKELHAMRARVLQRLGRIDEAQTAYAESHRLAQVELDLWKLTRSMPDIPNVKDCLRAAALYQACDDATLAAAWKTIANRIAIMNETEE